jgi:hypothetical protein
LDLKRKNISAFLKGNPGSKRIMIILILALFLFSILPLPEIEAKNETMTLGSPDGGEELVAGSTTKITWTVSENKGFIAIGISTNGGKDYENIDTVSISGFLIKTSYDWKIPPNMNSTKCKVKLVWVDSLTKPVKVYAESESKSNFTIIPGVAFEISELPETVSFGAYYYLKWSLYDPFERVEGLKFEWRTDNGSGWTSWGSIKPYYDWYDPGAGYIWWTPPYFESGEAQIRIRAYSEGNATLLHEELTDIMDIISPKVFLINPNGGVTLVAGGSYTIEWRTSEDPDEVITGITIHYTTNDGTDWNFLYNGPNDFSQSVTVPDISTSNFKVRVQANYIEFSVYGEDISDYGNRIISDSSIPSITLVKPNPPVPGGLVIPAGFTYNIEWTATGTSSLNGLKIELTTDNGSTYTTVANFFGYVSGPYEWTVPNVNTDQAKIRLSSNTASHGTQVSESVHPFHIPDPETMGNLPPVAETNDFMSVLEGTLVNLDGSDSYDPNRDPISYHWRQISPHDRSVTLDGANTATPSFTASVEDYAVTFVFELEVTDGKDYEPSSTELLYNRSRISVEVTPMPPEITSFYPDTGWNGTNLTVYGNNMMGAVIEVGGEIVATIPDHPSPQVPDPDHEYTFTFREVVPSGPHHVIVRTLVGEDSSEDEIEMYHEPTWLYDNGIGFKNQGTSHYSYPANPTHTGLYKDVFGNQVYVNLWVCIGLPVWTPWTGMYCLGYEIEQPMFPEPLAAILYGAVFDDIGDKGECFGMSCAALEYYHGRKDKDDWDQTVDDWDELTRDGDFHRHIKKRQGTQISAEVLHAYLGTLINGLVPSSDVSGMGVLIDMVKHSIDTGELGIMSLIDGGGHAVVPYAYEDRDGKTYFYVYDSNREYFTDPESANDAAQNHNDAHDNPPVVIIDRSGTYWDWSFEFNSTETWGSEIGIGFVPYSTVVGDRTLPTTPDGIIDLIMGSATMEIEGEGGERTGLDNERNIIWEMEDGAPLPFFGGAGDIPNGFFIPKGNYSHDITGTENGSYNWSIINNGSSAFTINDADVNEGSEDNVNITYPEGNPYLGEMTYSTTDDSKEYDAGIIHEYGPRIRTFEVLGAELNDDGEHGNGIHTLSVTEGYDGIVFTNNGGGPTTFDVVFTTNVMDQESVNESGVPGYGYPPSATRSGITVGPGETVILRPSNWLDLNNSIVIMDGETAPGNVTNLLLEEVGAQVEISWDAPLDNGGWPVFEYRVMRGNSTENLTMIGTTNTTSFTDEDAERGITYYYSVVALNAIGVGNMIDPASIEIPLITAPGSPSGFKGELVDGKISLSWSPPVDDGGSEVTDYVVFKGTSADDLSLLTQTGNETAYVDSDIQSNNTYFYQVAAVNSIGQGVLAEVISVEFPAEQPPPDDDDTDDDDDGDDDDEDDNNWIIFLIIGIIVVLLIIVIFVFLSSRNKGDEDYEE